jgi:hypothetical protein
MSKWQSQLKEEIAIVARREAIKFILYGVISAASYYLVTSIRQPHGWLAQNRPALSVLAGSVVGLGAFFTSRRLSRFHPVFPRLECDFMVLEKEVYYTYDDLRHMKYEKRLRVRALRNGLKAYPDKYAWTGRGQVSARSLVGEHDYIEIGKQNVWTLYEVRFPMTLSRGDEVEIAVAWELEDTEMAATPFFSSTVEEPTDKPIMRLHLSTTAADCVQGGRGVVCNGSVWPSSGVSVASPTSAEHPAPGVQRAREGEREAAAPRAR